MRKRTPQLGCLFALPPPTVSTGLPLNWEPQCHAAAGLLAPASPAYWSGWLLGRAAVGKGGRAASALLPLPPPALSPQMRPGLQEGCSGGNKTGGQHSLCQAVPEACWSWMTTAALHSGLHLSGMIQSHGWLFSRARSTHTGDPHPCLDLGTVLTSHCEVQSAALLLSPAITAITSQGFSPRVFICSLFGLTGGKGLKHLLPRRHEMKLGVEGKRDPPALLSGQEIPKPARPSL